MKLKLTIAVALAGLVYAIMQVFAPDLPFTADQVLTFIVVLLGWLGVEVTEARTRAALVARGYRGFIKTDG